MPRTGSHFPKQADLAGGFCEKPGKGIRGSGLRFSFKKVRDLFAPSPVAGWERPRDTASRSSSQLLPFTSYEATRVQPNSTPFRVHFHLTASTFGGR